MNDGINDAPPDRYDVLIVGAGHGGTQAAIALRQGGFEGSIAMLSTEHDAPYERAPLSKDYLLGHKSFERILIRPKPFWAERRIALLLGRPVVRVAPTAQRVHTSAALRSATANSSGRRAAWRDVYPVRALTLRGSTASARART